MPETPEQKARHDIDAKLVASGWLVQDRDDLDLTVGRGIAVREFPMKSGFGFADYLLYLDRKAVGAVEAKAAGALTGVEAQSAKYAAGLPDNLPAHRRPLPFLFESNGAVTFFTNGDLDARLKSAQALRQSILRHAFTGQLVPQDPNDEPASELLKRIATEREERARLAPDAKRKARPDKAGKARGSRRARTDAHE